MSQPIAITNEDVLKQVKLSYKTPEIIEGIVARKIISAAAEQAEIEIKTEELQKAADQFRLMNKLNKVDETRAWLQKYSLTFDDFEEIIYTSFLSGKFATHLFADQVEPYFFEHQLDYAGAVIYEIVLNDEDLATELFYALQEDEISFFDMAHQYIQDLELRRQCGYRGIVQRKDLKPEISAAVFAAKSPQVLKPIVSAKGIHLILVEEIIQLQLDDKLRYQILSNLLSEWLKQQIEQAEVVTNFAGSN